MKPTVYLVNNVRAGRSSTKPRCCKAWHQRKIVRRRDPDVFSVEPLAVRSYPFRKLTLVLTPALGYFHRRRIRNHYAQMSRASRACSRSSRAKIVVAPP